MLHHYFAMAYQNEPVLGKGDVGRSNKWASQRFNALVAKSPWGLVKVSLVTTY